MSSVRPPSKNEPPSSTTANEEAIAKVSKAREASAYAAGAAKASWESLIRAADKASEAAEAWELGESSHISSDDSSPSETIAVAAAEETVRAALPAERRRRVEQTARIAESRAREAREVAEFTGGLALQAARAWGEAEAAWAAIANDASSNELQNGSIEIVANGTTHRITVSTSVAAFIESKGLSVDSCIAELNGTVLTRPELSTNLNSGDRLEIIRAVAGGGLDGSLRRQLLGAARLYFICSASGSATGNVQVADAALSGGAKILQLRDHNATDRELLDAAHELRELADRHSALFLINDRADIAMIANADGVHIGQDDIEPADARQLLGPERIVGLSTHSESEVLEAQDSGADYIGVGPVFATPTKPGRPGVGLDLVKFAASRSALPFFAIGGINSQNAAKVRAAGASRVAVVRAIADAADPKAEALEISSSLTPG